MGNEYFDSHDLEKLTGIKASTWRYWASINAGPAGFPPSFKIGRRRLWRQSAVLEWLAAQEEAASV
jgi:predicted DNA-binding transcriptional regulator AlpA